MKGALGWLLAGIAIFAFVAQWRERGVSEAARAELVVARAQADTALARLDSALIAADTLGAALEQARADIARAKEAARVTAAHLSAEAQDALALVALETATTTQLKASIVRLVAKIEADSIADARAAETAATGMTIAEAQIYADSVVKDRLTPALDKLRREYEAKIAAMPKPRSALWTWVERLSIGYVAFQVGQAAAPR